MPSFHSAEKGLYSDMVIKCGTDEYRAHKVIVCTRSPFFAKACNGPFKEGKTGVIDLVEDDPQVVAAMMSFLYRGSYPRVTGDMKGPRRSSSARAGRASYTVCHLHHLLQSILTTYPGDEIISLQEEYLPLHAKVYALAEKYEISGLKETALRSFGFLLTRTISPHTFASAVEIAYTTVVESDRGLRYKVLEALYANVKFLDDPAVKSLLKQLPDLAYEFLLHRHECDKEAAAPARREIMPVEQSYIVRAT